jgi:hypothetical protein
MLYRLFNSEKEKLKKDAKVNVKSWFYYNLKYNSGKCPYCCNSFFEMNRDEDIERHFKGECKNVLHDDRSLSENG